MRHYPPWSESEDELVRQTAYMKVKLAVQYFTDRTYKALNGRRAHLGLTQPKQAVQVRYRIDIGITEAFRDKLINAADMQGISVAKFVRTLLEEKLDEAGDNPFSLQGRSGSQYDLPPARNGR